jgi:hypothetical protein
MKVLIHTHLPHHLAAMDEVVNELKKRNHNVVYTTWDPNNRKGARFAPRFNANHIPTGADCSLVAFGPAKEHKIAHPCFLIPSSCQIANNDPPMNHSMIEYGLIPGQLHLERYREAKNPFTKPVLTGWPKVDRLINNKGNGKFRDDLIKKHNLDPKKPIVTFAPTYNVPVWNIQPNSVTHWAKDVYRNLKDIANVIFLIHELDDWKGNESLPNAVRDCNRCDYMLGTDILIGDRSGIMCEFLLLDKPIIHLWTTEQKDGWPHNLWRDPNRESIKYGARIPVSKIRKTVEEYLSDSKKDADLRSYWRSRIFHNPDGKTAIRIVDVMEEKVGKK